MDNIYVNTCRTCLTESSNMKLIFEVDNYLDTKEMLSQMLAVCSSIQVLKGDGLPESICLRCVQEIQRAYTFRMLCEKSDIYLRQSLNNFSQNSKLSHDFRTNHELPTECLENLNVEKIVNKQDNYYNHELSDGSGLNCNGTNGQLLTEKSGNVNVKSEEKLKIFACDICDNKFNSEILFQQHRSRHKTNKSLTHEQQSRKNKTDIVKPRNLPRACNVCNKTFRFHSNLERHKLVHSGEKPFLCNMCGKGFSQLAYLKIHSFTHTGERPYKCSVCELSFSAPGTLRTHIRTHTGERPHVCLICGKNFLQSGCLNSHMRTHTGEKPMECKVCHKEFSQSGRLRIHMRIHTGEKPYLCKECGKSFAVKSTLKKHLRTHTGEKPYVCGVCGHGFAQRGTLIIHVKVHKK